MSKRIISIAAGAFAFAVCGSAFGADMAVKAPPPAPAPAPIYNWAGFYIGANLGGGWQSASTSYAGLSIPVFGNLTNTGIAGGVLPSSTSQNSSGFLGGVTTGYNLQSNSFVYGIEGDWMGTNLRGTSTVVTNDVPVFPTLTTATETNTDWLATLRARAGLLVVPQALLYATGGLAGGEVKGSTSVTPSGIATCANNSFCSAGSGSNTLWGWTVGGGAEYLFAPHWSAKIEYLYYDLGTLSYTTFVLTPGSPTTGSATMNVSTRVTGSIVRGGLNYKF
jgi:outer membrane immunogenic protein